MTELTIDRPITGDINRRDSTTTPQEGPTEFLAAIDAVLDIPSVESIIWDQYTPYFNDGEPCEFRVGEVRVRFEGTSEKDEDNSDYGDGGFTPWQMSYYRGQKPGHYGYDSLSPAVLALTDEEVDAVTVALAFERFETVLATNFGDPARVTATREGFNVEYYEHD